ncbi:hypothetical protein AB0F17_55515 [Nonomuraea sp. NPDC026600]|uniref:hypothetical protein n=1 Tax=Nonomuraea sp. NPDC026600 TaxID=3155363 RepID=UPI0033F1410D
MNLAALAAPASRTAWWDFLEELAYYWTSSVCPLSSEPPVFTDVGWLVEIHWATMFAELNGWPTAVMALGLSAALALGGRRGAIAGWMTAALFVVIAVMFTMPYAIEIVSDGCMDTLRFGGWDIVEYGPLLQYVTGAVLVMFLALVRREETNRCAPLGGTLSAAGRTAAVRVAR